MKRVLIKKNIIPIIFLASLFLYLSISFILAQGTTTVSNDPLIQGIKNFFTQWASGEGLNVGMIKGLLWALVSILVYSIAHFIPGLNQIFSGSQGGKQILGIAFAVIVGFLSMAYITPAEVYAIMTSYSGLGFTLTYILPFIILVFWTFTLASDTTANNVQVMVAQRLLAYLTWWVFLGYQIFRLLYIVFYNETLPSYYLWGHVLSIVITIIMLFGVFGYIFRWTQREAGNAVIDNARRRGRLASVNQNINADSAEALATGTTRTIVDRGN